MSIVEGRGSLDNDTASSGAPMAIKINSATARTRKLLEMLDRGKFPHYVALLGKIPALRGRYNGCGLDRPIYIMRIEPRCSPLPAIALPKNPPYAESGTAEEAGREMHAVLLWT